MKINLNEKNMYIKTQEANKLVKFDCLFYMYNLTAT